MAAIQSASVIICTRNRAHDLAGALETIGRLASPAGCAVEVIVVDNASTDHTPQVVEQARRHVPFPLHLLREEQRGLGAARNCGLRAASGEVIAFTDDDCMVSADWLERIIAHLGGKDRADVLGGRVELFNPAHLPMTVLTAPTPHRLTSEEHPGGLLLGCNMAFHRRVLDAIGGFAQRAGFAVRYEPDVLLHHNHGRTTQAEATSLMRGYAYSDGACLMKHLLERDRLAGRHFYWRLRSLVQQARRPADGPATHLGFGLVRAYLQGAARYMLHSRRLPGAPRIARPPPKAMEGMPVAASRTPG
jgi:glycosyltransferase involved in cell wall biosynthesis